MAIAIRTLEDERTVSYVPLLVLSEEVIFLTLTLALSPKRERGLPSPALWGKGWG